MRASTLFARAYTMSKKVVIVGGHGSVSLKLARFLTPNHVVTSIIRNPDHEQDIKNTKAKPLILSLEDSPVTEFTNAFEGSDVVYFSAGAGGKGPEERTKKVDYEGAVKVFDAIEGVKGAKPRLVLVSCIDIRDPAKIPEHYTEEDKKVSELMRSALATYMHWKYEADKVLVKRDSFKWTIIRPGGLTDNSGTGKVAVGRTHLTERISRDDVALTLSLLVDRDDAAGLALDLVGGDTPVGETLDNAIKRGETDFFG